MLKYVLLIAIAIAAVHAQETGSCNASDNNNPCSPLRVAGRYYYAYMYDTKQFVQCDAFGGCFERPCAPGTYFSYDVSVCITSPPDPVTNTPRAPEVLILLDVSESLKDFLSEITGFLQTFYSVTTEETFFQNHNRKVTVALFDEGLVGEQWVIDYSKYATVTELVGAETQELNSIITTILTREATGKTNIGQTLLDAKPTFGLDGYWKVIMVSDFINMLRQPNISQAMDQYDNAQIRTVPVIVDKEIRDEDIYNAVRQASLDNYGIDLRADFGVNDVNAIYNLGGR